MKLKTKISVFLCLVFLISSFAGFGNTANALMSNGFGYTVLSDSTAEITLYTGKDTVVTVPESIEGHTVSGIGNYAFFEKDNITEIVLPDTINRIGKEAFHYCSGLKKINIPQGVKSIGLSAFQSCYELESITLSEALESLGDLAFSECYLLQSIDIPKNVQTIGKNCFFDCEKLAAITVNGENSYFAASDNVLYDKEQTKLIVYPALKTDSDYTLPQTVKAIEDNAFYCNESIKNVYLPEGISSIGKSAFFGCKKMNSIDLPQTVSSVGDTAFGYYYDDKYRTVKNDMFTVFAYTNSVGQAYAEKNGFAFFSTGVLIITTTAPVTEPTSTTSSTTVPVSTTGQTTQTTASAVKYGDVNNDGKINSKDSLVLKQYNANCLSEKETFISEAADVNSDGKINGKDSMTLKKFIADIFKTLPYTEK